MPAVGTSGDRLYRDAAEMLVDAVSRGEEELSFHLTASVAAVVDRGQLVVRSLNRGASEARLSIGGGVVSVEYSGEAPNADAVSIFNEVAKILRNKHRIAAPFIARTKHREPAILVPEVGVVLPEVGDRENRIRVEIRHDGLALLGIRGRVAPIWRYSEIGALTSELIAELTLPGGGRRWFVDVRELSETPLRERSVTPIAIALPSSGADVSGVADEVIFQGCVAVFREADPPSLIFAAGGRELTMPPETELSVGLAASLRGGGAPRILSPGEFVDLLISTARRSADGVVHLVEPAATFLFSSILHLGLETRDIALRGGEIATIHLADDVVAAILDDEVASGLFVRSAWVVRTGLAFHRVAESLGGGGSLGVQSETSPSFPAAALAEHLSLESYAVVEDSLGGKLVLVRDRRGVATLGVVDWLPDRYETLATVSLFPLTDSDVEELRALQSGVSAPAGVNDIPFVGAAGTAYLFGDEGAALLAIGPRGEGYSCISEGMAVLGAAIEDIMEVLMNAEVGEGLISALPAVAALLGATSDRTEMSEAT